MLYLGYANKRHQLDLAIPEIDTPITALVDDHSILPAKYLNNVLPEFDDPSVGLCGTAKVVRRRDLTSRSLAGKCWERFWNVMGMLYLERHNLDAGGEHPGWRGDGDIWTSFLPPDGHSPRPRIPGGVSEREAVWETNGSRRRQLYHERGCSSGLDDPVHRQGDAGDHCRRPVQVPPTVRPMAAYDVPVLRDPIGGLVVAPLAVDGLDHLPPHAVQSEPVLGLVYCLYLRSH